MADLGSKIISSNYQKLLQISSSGEVSDGTGSAFPLKFNRIGVGINHDPVLGYSLFVDGAISASTLSVNPGTIFIGQTTMSQNSDGGLTFRDSASNELGAFQGDGFFVLSSSLANGGITKPLFSMTRQVGSVQDNNVMQVDVKSLKFIQGTVGQHGQWKLGSVGSGSAKSADFFINNSFTGGPGTNPAIYITGSGTNYVGLGSFSNSTNRLDVSGSLLVSGPKGHITASGNISASGIITAEGLVISDDFSLTDDLTVGGNITASGNISASGTTHTFGEVTIDATHLFPTPDNGLALGKVGNEWADLFLNAGGVINFNNDMTITHLLAGNNLAIAGGSLSASGDFGVTGNATLGDAAADTHTITGKTSFVGNITASGNISSSGNINALTGTGSFGQIHQLDNQKILIGTGNDLQISHNGSDSFIIDTGTGDLIVRAATDFKVQATSTNEDMIKAIKDGGVELYHNNAKKLETEAGGIDVTGHITASGNISGSGTGSFEAGGVFGGNVGIGTSSPVSTLHVEQGDIRINTADDATQALRFSDTGTTKAQIQYIDDGETLNILTGGSTNAIEITNTQGVKFSSHITASGNISASGTIIANAITLPNNAISGDKVEGGTIAAITITDLTATSLNVTHLTSSFITSSTIVTEGSNTFGDTIADTHTFNGHITASGNISASGTGIIGGNVLVGGSSLTNPQSWGKNLQVINSGANGSSISVMDSNNEYSIATYQGNLHISDGTAERISILSDGKVGIGVNNPTTALQVEGNISGANAAGSMLLDLKSAASSTDHDAGIRFYKQDTLKASVGYNAGTDTVNLNYGGFDNTHLNIDSSGNVGIGISSPQSLLHIKDSDHTAFRIDSSGGTDKDTTIRFSGSAQTWDAKQYAQGSVNDGQYGFHIVDVTNSKFPFSIQPNNASKTLVLSGSNVGIGTSTPTKALEVVGDISASGDIFVGDDLFIADAGVINYNNSEIEIKHDGPRLVISGSGATELQVEGISDLNGAVDIDGGDLTVGSALQLTSGGVFTFGSGLDNGRITWGSEFASLYGLADNKLRLGSFNVQGVLTISSSTENTMVISGSNVGIGTSDPTKTLTVEGEISASNDLTIDDGTRSLLYDVSAHKLKFGGANAEITAGGYNLKFIANTDGAGATDGFIFTTGSDAIPLMKMQTNGNIGIGTTSPGEALEVIGNISASVTSTGSFGHITTDGRVDVGSRLNVSNAVSNFHSLNVGGGYGATGVSISTAGAIQMNNKLTVDGDISGSADSTGSFGRVDTVDGSIFGNRYVLSTQTIAAAGDAQGNATLVDVDGGSTVFVTGGDDAKGVRLPVVADSIIGQTFTIHNTATSALKVYPGSGDKILPAADNTAIEIAGSAAVIVTHFSADGFVGYEPAVIVSD